MIGARRTALLLALAAAFADAAYEGGRSVVGVLAGIVGGRVLASLLALSEGVSGAARIVSGVLVARFANLGTLLAMVVLGYGLVMSVPAMALASSPGILALLVSLERAGKGIRAPARDLLLSWLGNRGGYGRLFGFVEFVDQVGAVSGPLVVFAASSMWGIGAGFAVLALPAALSLASAVAAAASYPWDVQRVADRSGGSALVGVVAASMYLPLAHWFAESWRLGSGEAAAMYSLAMAMDALAAIAMGHVLDRVGPRALTSVPILAAAASILVHIDANLLTVAVWGAALGAVEVGSRYLVAYVNGGARGFAAMHVASGLFWGLNAAASLSPIYPMIVMVLASVSTYAVARIRRIY